MKYLNNYINFNEKFNLLLTDEPSVSKSKEYYNELELSIKQYNTNKSNLKKFYTAVDKDGNLLYDDINLKKEVEKLTGKNEIKDFFLKYLDLLKIERDIIKKQKTQSNEQKNLDSLKSTENSTDTKEKDPRIADTEEKMNLNNSEISELRKRLLNDEKEFKEMMNEISIEINNSKNIINSPKNNKIQIGNVVSLKK